MASEKPVIHGDDHHPNGPDPLRWMTSGGVYATSPQVLPILMGEQNSYQGLGWTSVVVDTTVRGNAIRTNGNGRTAAVDDYLTEYVTLGPKGSAWGITLTYKGRPDGGQFTFALATVTETSGVLSSTQPGSYVEFGSTVDTYLSSAGDVSFNGYPVRFVIGGDDGDLFTSAAATDPTTGFPLIDGGSGVYSLRVRVTGKNASSSGYRCDLTGVALVRLNDIGLAGGF